MGGFSKMLDRNPYTNQPENNFINRKEQNNDFFFWPVIIKIDFRLC